jgi:hypothetical protein
MRIGAIACSYFKAVVNIEERLTAPLWAIATPLG